MQPFELKTKKVGHVCSDKRHAIIVTFIIIFIFYRKKNRSDHTNGETMSIKKTEYKTDKGCRITGEKAAPFF